MKIAIQSKIDVYAVLTRAIEAGIEYGWVRAHKHTNTPDENTIKNSIENAIMLEISEVLESDEVPF